MPVKERHLARLTLELLPPELVFVLGFVFGSIATGFFEKMGSELYRKAKEKVTQTLKEKTNPTVKFEMNHKETKIIIISKTNDEKELSKIFDTIDKARDIAINELDNPETPKMTEIVVSYDKEWNLDSGEEWNPPRVIKLYRYNKQTGIWELTEDWSQK